MSLVLIAMASTVVLVIGYFTYGSLLARLFRLDANAVTPAQSMRDDVDYIPTDKKYLLGQHFSAIAAAGPIVGPILAGLMFGWGPALLWILIGSIFIGGVHDMGTLIASVRHKARSIAEVVNEHLSRRTYLLFLCFIWITIVYIIVAFTDMVASSFVGVQTLENGLTVKGAGIASSSMLYLALPIVMSLMMRYLKLPLWLATIIFLPLVGVAIWIGQDIPLDLAKYFGLTDPQAAKLWDVLLLAYCFVASILPMWLLLQPRGHLGGFFLYIAMAGGLLGVIFGGRAVSYPAFIGLASAKGEPLFPILFITVACGACSGFHALVSTGTTSKQLKSETDAKPIGYGGMLLEGLVAVISLSCVMMLAKDSPVLQGVPKPNLIYGIGMASFLETIGVPPAFGISFGLLAFATFVYDTLDVSTRLGRYVLQELTGWSEKYGRYLATAITVGVPLFLVMQKTTDAAGNQVPAWKAFWSLFGASNQLLAALSLMAITIWLHQTNKARWMWAVTGLPALFMYSMSGWALLRLIRIGLLTPTGELKAPNAATVVAMVLAVLALMLLVEMVGAVKSIKAKGAPTWKK